MPDSLAYFLCFYSSGKQLTLFKCLLSVSWEPACRQSSLLQARLPGLCSPLLASQAQLLCYKSHLTTCKIFVWSCDPAAPRLLYPLTPNEIPLECNAFENSFAKDNRNNDRRQIRPQSCDFSQGLLHFIYNNFKDYVLTLLLIILSVYSSCQRRELFKIRDMARHENTIRLVQGRKGGTGQGFS